VELCEVEALLKSSSISGGGGSCGGDGGGDGANGGGEGGANGTTKDFRSSDPEATVRPSCPRPDQLAPFQPLPYESYMWSSHSTPGERETPYSVWKSKPVYDERTSSRGEPQRRSQLTSLGYDPGVVVMV